MCLRHPHDMHSPVKDLGNETRSPIDRYVGEMLNVAGTSSLGFGNGPCLREDMATFVASERGEVVQLHAT